MLPEEKLGASPREARCDARQYPALGAKPQEMKWTQLCGAFTSRKVEFLSTICLMPFVRVRTSSVSGRQLRAAPKWACGQRSGASHPERKAACPGCSAHSEELVNAIAPGPTATNPRQNSRVGKDQRPVCLCLAVRRALRNILNRRRASIGRFLRSGQTSLP
jgi:hypothetical protein